MLWVLVVLLAVLAAILWLRAPVGGSPEVADDAEEGDEPASPVDVVTTAVGDSIDLHGLPAAEVGPVVDAYVEEARRLGHRRVRIIHGRGIGVARRTVRVHLERSPHVQRFHDAPPPSGPGATIALLHPADDDIATPPNPH